MSGASSSQPTQIDDSSPAKWCVNRRFTEFDELRKRVEEDDVGVRQWGDLFPSKYSVDEVQALFDPEKRAEQVRELTKHMLAARSALTHHTCTKCWG